ncbi:hypothetical protein LV75_003728 [Actinokineospora diospyrosa]|uniref:Uncharacterized protein n=1 Tax=Actinokineospora diospyrosa TaxID=103728 RepID=A0ABT1IF17_9PSEU|nr:hypothetical protein [Actinokineospora diospyrosa]
MPTRPPVRSAPTHLASAWTLGPAGANPPPVRSAPAHLPSTWTVGLAGAKPARWGGLVLCGGTAPVAFPRGRACFWAPALRFCVGCCRGPAQNKFAPSSLSHCRGSDAMPKASRSPEPKAEARISCPALPATADVKINLIESPQIHSLPTRTDTTAAPNSTLWTPRTVVDNHNQPARSSTPRAPDIQPTDAHRQPGSTKQQPVDSHNRCGQTTPAPPASPQPSSASTQPPHASHPQAHPT